MLQVFVDEALIVQVPPSPTSVPAPSIEHFDSAAKAEQHPPRSLIELHEEDPLCTEHFDLDSNAEHSALSPSVEHCPETQEEQRDSAPKAEHFEPSPPEECKAEHSLEELDATAEQEVVLPPIDEQEESLARAEQEDSPPPTVEQIEASPPLSDLDEQVAASEFAEHFPPLLPGTVTVEQVEAPLTAFSAEQNEAAE